MEDSHHKDHITISVQAEVFLSGDGKSRTKETCRGCGSPCLCELTQSAQITISEPVKRSIWPSIAIPKDSFISPFQIAVALMVSKIHSALIICHLVLLFMETISHLLSAHWEHEFPEETDMLYPSTKPQHLAVLRIYLLIGWWIWYFTWNEGSWRPAYFCVPSNQAASRPQPWARPIKTCLSWSFGNRRRKKTICFRRNQAERKKRSGQNGTKANLPFKASSQIPMDEVITHLHGTLLPGSQALAVPRPLHLQEPVGQRRRQEAKRGTEGSGQWSNGPLCHHRRNLTELLHLCRYFRTGRSMYETELMLATKQVMVLLLLWPLAHIVCMTPLI